MFILVRSKKVNDMNAPSQSAKDCFLLKPLTLEHIPTITQWYERIDDLILFDRRIPLPISASAMEATFRESILAPEPRTSHWFVICDVDDSIAGLAGLQEINYIHGDAVLAIMVAESYRRSGLGVRTCALLLDIGFHQLRLTRVSSSVSAENVASQRMTEKVGFQEEGRIRGGSFANGRHSDALVIGILSEEWENRRTTLMTELNSDTCVKLGDGSSGRWSWPQMKDSRTLVASAD